MKTASTILCVLGLSVAAWGQPSAQLGDRAPGLDVTFVKGRPIVMGSSPQVVVVEFWATWCGPCKQTIPHLTKIQAKYRDLGLQVVGISTEDEATVMPYVTDMGENMAYTVAVDNNFETARNYMAAYGVDTIPHAFIVNKAGSVVWNGHPGVPEFEETLVQLLGPAPQVTTRDEGPRPVSKEELDAILRERARRAGGTPPPPGPRDDSTRPQAAPGEFIVINNQGVTKPAEEIEGFSFVEKKQEAPPPAEEPKP